MGIVITRKENLDINPKFKKSVEKAKHKNFILNWSNPRRHVNDELLRYIFKHRLGIDISMNNYEQAFTIEELAYCLDKLGILDRE